MILTLLLFILILGVIVLVHETGHFLLAKAVGVHVYEFSIGMGPLIFKHIAKDKTQYSIRCIPIGGYVSLAGEEANLDTEKHKGHNLQDKTVLQRFLVMVMGVCFNFLFAFILLFIVGLLNKAPSMDPVIANVTDNYPAYNAGIEASDRILKINGRKVTFIDDITLFLTIEDMQKKVNFEVQKPDGTIKNYDVYPEKVKLDGTDTYVIGITLKSSENPGFINSLVYAFKKEAAVFKQMFVVLGGLFTGKVSFGQLSGPVGIYSVVGQMKTKGLSAILYLIALLSINVGIVNILPFPAFDGGRVLFLIIEKLKGSPVSPKVENTIHAIGFVILIILMFFVTFNDILKLF